MNVDFFSDPFESRVNPIQLRLDFALEVGRPESPPEFIKTGFISSVHEWRPSNSEFDKLYRRHLKSLSVRKRTKLLIKHYVLKQ